MLQLLLLVATNKHYICNQSHVLLAYVAKEKVFLDDDDDVHQLQIYHTFVFMIHYLLTA